jgi:hypothetical protein
MCDLRLPPVRLSPALQEALRVTTTTTTKEEAQRRITEALRDLPTRIRPR